MLEIWTSNVRSPYTAHEKLLEEDRRDDSEAARENVCRHESSTDQARCHHCQAAACEGAYIPNCSSAEKSTDLSNYSHDCRVGGIHAKLVFEKRWVEVYSTK